MLRVFVSRLYGFTSYARVLFKRNPDLPPFVSFAGVAVLCVVAVAFVDSFRVALFLFCFSVMSLGPGHGLWSLVMWNTCLFVVFGIPGFVKPLAVT